MALQAQTISGDVISVWASARYDNKAGKLLPYSTSKDQHPYIDNEGSQREIAAISGTTETARHISKLPKTAKHYAIRKTCTKGPRHSHGRRVASPRVSLTRAAGSLPPPTPTAPICIVGGGPCGFVGALLLRKAGYTNITVLEKRTDPDFFDPLREFTYRIDLRGTPVLAEAGVMKDVEEIGVPHLETNLQIGKVHPDKPVEMSRLPNMGSTGTWITRSKLNRILHEHAAGQDGINVVLGADVTSLKKTHEGIQVIATVDGSEQLYDARLLLDCGGFRTPVRTALQQWHPDRFSMVQYPSAAGKLRFKVLWWKAEGMEEDALPEDMELSAPDIAYVGYPNRSLPTTQQLKVGWLPGIAVKPDGSKWRTGNLITLPSHEMWKIDTAEGMFSILEKNNPKVKVRSLVPVEIMQEFASSSGGRFPEPQYCRSAHHIVGETAVALVGDALHSFPPDLGQGVNSGLQDISALTEAVIESNGKFDIAVESYASKRLPEAEALVKLMQFGYPWQYDLPEWKLQKAVWSLNAGLRLLLNKFLPQMFFGPGAMFASNPAYTYSEVVQKAHATTAKLRLLGFVAIVLGGAIIFVRGG